MTRFMDVDDAVEQFLTDPGFYGISFYRDNPCCAKEVARFGLHPDAPKFEDLDEAAVYFTGLAKAIDVMRDRFAADPNNFTTGAPCESCLEKGDVDLGWLRTHAFYMEGHEVIVSTHRQVVGGTYEGVEDDCILVSYPTEPLHRLRWDTVESVRIMYSEGKK